MKKAPEAFRTISEVAELLETPAHVLRFWESKFYQIRPVKRAGGRRYYRPDDVALINGIRAMLQEQGLTIRGAQRVLQEKGVRHVAAMGAELKPLQEAAADLTAAPDPGPGPKVPLVPEALPGALPGAVPGAVPGGPDAARAPGPRQDPTEAAPALADGIGRPQDAGVAQPVDHAAAVLRKTAPAFEAGHPDADEMAVGPEGDGMAEPAERPGPRLPHLLREMPRELPERSRDRLAAIARRIDSLLDRMSEASGAGRW